MVKSAQTRIVAVTSVLALAAGLLVSSSSGAVADDEIKSFEFRGVGTVLRNCDGSKKIAGVLGGSSTNGSGQFITDRGNIAFTNARASSSMLAFTIGSTPFGLPGEGWTEYGGYGKPGTCSFTFARISIPYPPSGPQGGAPRTPRNLKIAGLPTTKSFKVSWKTPLTKGRQPVIGYRLVIKARGGSKAAVDRNLRKRTKSFKVARKTLLKSLRSTNRGESNVRFNVRVYALSNTSVSVPARSVIRIRP